MTLTSQDAQRQWQVLGWKALREVQEVCLFQFFVVLQILICFTMLALRWEHFAKPRLSQTAFLVKHFADQVKLSKRDEYWNRQKRWIMDKTVKRRMGRDWIKPRKENGKRSIFAQVEYECDGFLHKNRDTVMEEQVWFHKFWRALFHVFLENSFKFLIFSGHDLESLQEQPGLRSFHFWRL